MGQAQLRMPFARAAGHRADEPLEGLRQRAKAAPAVQPPVLNGYFEHGSPCAEGAPNGKGGAALDRASG